MDEIIICRDCDAVYARTTLSRGELARCTQCGSIIGRHVQGDLDSVLAIACACLILLAIANFTPVLAVEIAGTQTQANIWLAALSMQHGPIAIAAIVLLVTMLLVPSIQVLALLWLMSFARAGRRAPGFVCIMVSLHRLRPWGMCEVFLLGSLVAIVKLGSFIPIFTGPGTWALALLTMMLAELGHFDPRWWWTLDKSPRT